MFIPSATPIFGITHPLGLPRPVDPDNVFGAKSQFFVRNLMPVPTGCLEHFDAEVYRPYMERLVVFLGGEGGGWSASILTEAPARYCLLRQGTPAPVPADVRPLLPEPPRVDFESLLAHFDRIHAGGAPFQILDVLTLISEDIGPEKFAAATAGHPWVAVFMR